MSYGVSPEHTSVPRWSQQPPDVDGSGRNYLVISCGAEGRLVASAWSREILARGSKLERFHGPAPAVWLTGRLAQARVGVRVMAAGPQLELLDVLRAARAQGMIDAELALHVTDAARLRVHCAHCGADTEAAVQIGEMIGCAGCGRSLVVYHHVSRPRGAHLGYQVDAEEPAA
ncbi:MAG TPA: dimethylamine monooxygenase subunit DmmA family protein [Steroidobacteraceae bacterium]|nr:dimethylamine monooxygenase subunit DmmA family protein [Steroidobacteraceae bacterium]